MVLYTYGRSFLTKDMGGRQMVLYTYSRSFLTKDMGEDRWFCTLMEGRS